MAEKYELIHDIIEEHNERVQNLKKYYPFFKLADSAFYQYKDGRYADLDMGYITMAVLRFFIEENNFKEREVTYEVYREFIGELLERDFDLHLKEAEEGELALYIFDKIKNEGRPFRFSYFDPADKTKKTLRMHLLESRMQDNEVLYHISADAIEFYLDTKEIKEESSISIEQLLLEKLIDSNNFKGATEVIQRINNEVSRLQYRKNQVLQLLNEDLKEGLKACEAFLSLGTKWFAQEQKLFAKNSDLIHQAILRVGSEGRSGEDGKKSESRSEGDGKRNGMGNRKTLEEIYELETQLKRAIQKHSELLRACTDLQLRADEMIHKAKFRSLHNGFDFKLALSRMKEADKPSLLAAFVLPLLDLNRRKTYDLPMMDNLLTYRPEKEEAGEKIQAYEEETYVYPDEVEEQRIQENYAQILNVFLDILTKRSRFTLEELQQALEERFGVSVLKNGDYYSFLVHLSQKKDYDTMEIRKKPDTFLEAAMKRWLDEREDFNMRFTLTMLPEELLKPAGSMEVTNILFERAEETP